MFNCFKKNKVYIDYDNNYCEIICDNNGIIKYTNDNFLSQTMYKKEIIINRNISILFNKFIGYYLENIIYDKFILLDKLEQQTNIIKFEIKLKKRLQIIYNILREPIYVKVLLFFFDNNQFTLRFIIINDELSNENIYSNKLIYNNFLYELSITKTKIVIIAIDFIDSTKILVNNGVLNYFTINKQFHNDIIKLIKKNYYPYIFIHEILGDSFILVTNFDINLIIPFIGNIIIVFLVELINLTKNYINIRIGITYDYINYVFIDSNLRFFGEAINMASRLENQCINNYEVNCCCDFMNKLINETPKIVNNLDVESVETEIKGFGKKQFYKIKNIISINRVI